MTATGPLAPKGDQGMTLIELLAAAAVIALLILITDRLFFSVTLAWRTTERAAELQQNARVAAARLRREIRESQGSAVTCYPDISCLTDSVQVAFPSARPSEAANVFCVDVAVGDPARGALESACPTPIPLTGTYTPVWQRHLGYHLNAAGELRRLAQPGPILLPMTSGTGQVVASEVESFTISRAGGLFRLRLRSSSGGTGGGGDPPIQEMRLDDTVQFKNSIHVPAG